MDTSIETPSGQAVLEQEEKPQPPPSPSGQHASEEDIIKIEGLRKVYLIGNEKVVALNRIDLTVKRGEIVCLLGTSGSGKSTLLNMIAGLEKPTKGSIIIEGQPVHSMSERKLASFRQKYMGFIFQAYNLLPAMTALENVSLPLTFVGAPRAYRNKKAAEMLKFVGLETHMKHKPTQMSGGQQQRVGIARAFVTNPDIILADEPTGNLDSKTTLEVMNLMVDTVHKNHQTMLIVSHDVSIARFADRIVRIFDGNISGIENVEKTNPQS